LKKVDTDMSVRVSGVAIGLLVLAGTGAGSAWAQGAAQPPRPPQGAPAPAPPVRTETASTGLPVPSDYVIGPDDVLNIVFWRDADMTQEVTVRPDGNITLPLVRDIKAAGLRPEELREVITKAAAKFIADPNVTVVVKDIKSRNVFITGLVGRPGPYPVSGQMTVLQLIAVSGGLTEYADGKNITIVRIENGKTNVMKFNYNDVARGKNVVQNVVLRPGDTVVVP
jgi:polysaccharide biosynthesis/export protein